MLTIVSLLTFLLLTFHMTGDIVYGWEKGGLANLVGVVVISGFWLYGALLLRERLAGYIILLLGSLLGLFVPYIHMGGKGIGGASRVAGHPGHFFFVWTLLAIGVLSLFSVILCVRGLWNLRGRKQQVE
jgi:hypothetical protein